MSFNLIFGLYFQFFYFSLLFPSTAYFSRAQRRREEVVSILEETKNPSIEAALSSWKKNLSFFINFSLLHPLSLCVFFNIKIFPLNVISHGEHSAWDWGELSSVALAFNEPWKFILSRLAATGERVFAEWVSRCHFHFSATEREKFQL